MTELFEKLQPYKQIIWDFNGTLIDDAEICVRAVNPILLEYGLKEIDLKVYRDFFRFPVQEYYVDLGFRLTDQEFKDLSHRFNETYQSHWNDARVFQGAMDLLHQLKGEGKILSVLSAAWQSDLHAGLDRFGLKHFFDHIFGLQDRLAACKIQRGRELLDASGINAADTVLLGDTLHDLDVGKSLGMDVFLLTEGHMSEERLRAGHHHVYSRR